eukprot:1805873-Amphidinium_carterae.1
MMRQRHIHQTAHSCNWHLASSQELPDAASHSAVGFTMHIALLQPRSQHELANLADPNACRAQGLAREVFCNTR